MDRRQAVSGLAAACLAAPFAGTARAQAAVADFYRGKQITLLVGYAPGGGYDITARLVARYIGKYIPGHPDIVVQNMPGAGSMRAANYTYVNAPKDGTTFALIARDTPLLGLLGVDPNVRFDVHKFGWVGSSSSYANDAYVLVLGPKAPAHTIAEARKPDTPPLVLGGTGAGGTDADVPKILRDTIGIRIKQVLGYTATPAIVLAVERGEVDGRTFDYSYVKKSRPQWLKSDSGFGILRAVRAAHAPSRPAERADRARARVRRQSARVDCVRRDTAPHHGAAIRSPAGCSARTARGLALGVRRRPPRS